jgi:succinate dehydrogenase / fumarate reductase flavoprotein subunit
LTVQITDRFSYDVVIMGAGLAGMSAAVKMAEDHPQLKVALLTKVHPVRSHSGAAQGGINAAVAQDDKWEDHYYDTLKGGWFLGDQDAVRVLTEEAPNAIFELDRWGAVFSRLPDGNFAQRPFGGQRRNRTCYVQDLSGHAFLSTMYEQVVKKGIDVFAEWFVFALVADADRFYGFLAFDLNTGKLGYFAGQAGLIATGGAGRIFGQSSNALINTGGPVCRSRISSFSRRTRRACSTAFSSPRALEVKAATCSIATANVSWTSTRRNSWSWRRATL